MLLSVFASGLRSVSKYTALCIAASAKPHLSAVHLVAHGALFNAVPRGKFPPIRNSNYGRWSYVADADIIFMPCGSFFLSSLFSTPNLSRRRLDVYHTTHDVALVKDVVSVSSRSHAIGSRLRVYELICTAFCFIAKLHVHRFQCKAPILFTDSQVYLFIGMQVHETVSD